ncbi:sensor histidine kinase [Streptacidiphilus monticola]
MRRVIGLLREDDADVERAPQPGIDSIPDMVRAARQAGMQVDLTLTGLPERPPTVVDVSVYRIVQEALSNAGRHAPGARVEIEVVRTSDAVRVVVADDGQTNGQTVTPGGNGGHGLTGMRERAALLGGTLHAAPGERGGFVVAAELPLGESAAEQAEQAERATDGR